MKNALENKEHKRTQYFNSLGSLYDQVAKNKQEARRYYELGLDYCLKNNLKEAVKFHRLTGSIALDLGDIEKAHYHLQIAISQD